MRIKPGASVTGLSTEILLAIMIAADCYAEHWQLPHCVITSCTDDAAKRLKHSLHKQGYAVDLRLPEAHTIPAIVAQLAKRLADEYDVVLEKDHIHVEYQP